MKLRALDMKMRTIRITPKLLLEALQGKSKSNISNLPEDIQLLDMRFDLCNNQVFLVLRSDSFEDIAELYPIPELKLDYTNAKPVLENKPFTRIEEKPKISTKSESKAQKETELGQTSREIENEFSPDQRQMLSFKVEGDMVIVKPTQFLKTEWNDINDVVKSLGGKWIKGDIISYWEVPLP